jgi:hypothetical protein
MAKANSDEFNIGGVVMRVVFSLAIVFLTFNPTGHSYFHWLQQNLTPIQPVVVIAGILLLGIGMSWAHIRAGISDQASVDRVDQYSSPSARQESRRAADGSAAVACNAGSTLAGPAVDAMPSTCDAGRLEGEPAAGLPWPIIAAPGESP